MSAGPFRGHQAANRMFAIDVFKSFQFGIPIAVFQPFPVPCSAIARSPVWNLLLVVLLIGNLGLGTVSDLKKHYNK